MANWQVDDRAFGIPVNGGWLYLDQKAIDYYGEEQLKNHPGYVDVVVSDG